MKNNADYAGPVDLLIDFLAMPGRTNASLVTASEDGIHWNAIRQAARLIKAVSQRSTRGQGNLNFAAIAMLKPYGPFYPGAYHAGGSRALFGRHGRRQRGGRGIRAEITTRARRRRNWLERWRSI